MLSVDSLPVAEEEVVESSSNRLGDIYTFVAEGCYPQTMNPIRKKNLKRYAQKFMIEGESKSQNVSNLSFNVFPGNIVYRHKAFYFNFSCYYVNFDRPNNKLC